MLAASSKAPCLAFPQVRDDGLERGDDFRAINVVFLELQPKREALSGSFVLEDERAWPSGLRLRDGVTRLLAGHSARPLAGQLLDQRDHFLGRLLPNYL